jgi:predicted DNA-binding protein
MVPARLSSEQHERLKQWCQANGFTMAVVLRGLVARFLEEQARRQGGQAASTAE